jgi:hypothetical protein
MFCQEQNRTLRAYSECPRMRRYGEYPSFIRNRRDQPGDPRQIRPESPKPLPDSRREAQQAEH